MAFFGRTWTSFAVSWLGGMPPAEMKQAIQEFSAHHEKTVKAEYERAVSDLRAARKQALQGKRQGDCGAA